MAELTHIVFHITYEEEKLAKGFLSINGKSYPTISGPYGKGFLPRGEYKLTSCYFMKDNGGVDAYKKEGKPWVAKITPCFTTKRTGLYIHPDGNVEGSLGCAAITEGDLDAKKEIDLLLSKTQTLTVQVI